MHVFSSHGVCNKNLFALQDFSQQKKSVGKLWFWKKACGEQLYVGGGSNRLPEVLI